MKEETTRRFEKHGGGGGSNTPISGAWPPLSNGGQNANCQSTRRSRDEDMATCFNCQKLGHWVKDCPKISPRRTPQPPFSGRLVFHCTCGGGPCVVLVSESHNNPRRKYYRCTRYFVGKCDLFRWCDSVSNDEMIYTPICGGCGAGPCRIQDQTRGAEGGRRFFVCPIKKGYGACDFTKPLDDTTDHLDESVGSPQSTLTYCDTISPSNSDLAEERCFTHQGIEIESPVVDTPEHPSHQGMQIESPVVDTPELPHKLKDSELSKKERLPMVDFWEQEGSSNEPWQKHRKRMRHRAPKIDGLVLDSISNCNDMSQSKSGDSTMETVDRASVLTSEALIHQRQAEFLRQISSAGASLLEASSTPSYYSSALPTTRELKNCLESAAIYQILGFHFKGWCGRLVFYPSRGLTFPKSKPFFCCVFPSFDQIVGPQDVNKFGAEASTIEMHNSSSVNPTLITAGQSLGALLREPSDLKSPPKILQVMKQSMLDIFKQAAMHLQDGLLTLLESMDFHDHESMLRGANSAFGALDGLIVDYQPFREQELVYWYNRKKLQLEDISHLHSETSTTLKASNEQLQSLLKEVSCLKDTLFHKEVELSCVMAENNEICTRFDQISKDKLQSELDLQVKFEKAEKALKLCQQREAERNIAKTSFEEARSKLR
ncbi:uncharacterized protein LOC130755493 isoform X2 [Actinidia eriantha]|uniref:uncharacterized protein LOC130755493 isoform X2 n=1 Tax=Actinidia eriantha TaxID=165200 RepID=UPI002582D01B|nr:uncharacterized protein LOC130755493 isoform X2 [Actinidia eriantha]